MEVVFQPIKKVHVEAYHALVNDIKIKTIYENQKSK